MKSVYVLTISQWHKQDSDDGYTYSDEWVTDSVRIYKTRKEALQYLKQQQVYCEFGESFEKSCIFYEPNCEYYDDDEDDLSLYDYGSQTFSKKFKDTGCTKYELFKNVLSCSIDVGKTGSCGYEIVHLAFPFPYSLNLVLSSPTLIIRNEHEIDDLLHYIEDYDKKQLKSFKISVKTCFLPLSVRSYNKSQMMIKKGILPSGATKKVSYKDVLHFLMKVYSRDNKVSQIAQVKAELDLIA